MNYDVDEAEANDDYENALQRIISIMVEIASIDIRAAFYPGYSTYADPQSRVAELCAEARDMLQVVQIFAAEMEGAEIESACATVLATLERIERAHGLVLVESKRRRLHLVD